MLASLSRDVFHLCAPAFFTPRNAQRTGASLEILSRKTRELERISLVFSPKNVLFQRSRIISSRQVGISSFPGTTARNADFLMPGTTFPRGENVAHAVRLIFARHCSLLRGLNPRCYETLKEISLTDVRLPRFEFEGETV